MEVINIGNKEITLLLPKEELGILRAVSVHVLYEFAMTSNYDIFASTGWKKTEAEAFSEKLQKHYEMMEKNKTEYIFSRRELTFMVKIIEDAVREIDWEFQTLTGYTIKEALALKNSLKTI